MADERVSAAGKQLLLDGAHLADCRDPRAAEVIAICLNRGRLKLGGGSDLTAAELTAVEEFFA